jgi:hypothetical protein
MIWRVADEAVGDKVDDREGQPPGLERNLDNICRGRLSLSDRQHAHGDEGAILAAIVLLFVVILFVRTTLHVSGHGSHIAHLANRQPLCRSRGHQRRSSKPSDHKDRKQTTDESAKIHTPPSHGTGNL